jgi:hypothetical protein
MLIFLGIVIDFHAFELLLFDWSVIINAIIILMACCMKVIFCMPDGIDE